MRIQIDLPDSDVRFLMREGVDDLSTWTRRLVESEIALMKCFPSPTPREVRADPAGLPAGTGWDLTFSPPKLASMEAGEKRPETGRYSRHAANKKRDDGNVVRLADFRRGR